MPNNEIKGLEYLDLAISNVPNGYTVFENYYTDLFLSAFRAKLKSSNDDLSQTILDNIKDFDLICMDKKKRGGWARSIETKEYYLIDNLLRPVNKLPFNRLGIFKDSELCPFQIENAGLWGFMDYSGKAIVEPKYTDVNPFQENFAKVAKKKKKSFIDLTGQEVIPFKYDYISDFSEGAAVVSCKGDQGYIDTKGVEFIQARPGICTPFINGLAIVVFLKHFHIDKSGTPIGDSFDNVSAYAEGLSMVIQDKKYGFKNLEGKVAIPIAFEEAKHFSQGRALVKQNTKWGFIDPNGKLVIDYQYEKLLSFAEDVAWCQKNDQTGFIHKDGTFAIPLDKYEFLDNYCQDGLIKIKKDGKTGFLDRNNKIRIPISFDNASPFTNGITRAYLNGQKLIIDTNGQPL